MKHAAKILCLSGLSFVFSSCMTTYDAQGRPVQSVDPGAAVVGAAAAATLGYALAKDRKNKHHYDPRQRYYQQPRHYRGRYHSGHRYHR